MRGTYFRYGVTGIVLGVVIASCVPLIFLAGLFMILASIGPKRLRAFLDKTKTKIAREVTSHVLSTIMRR